MPLGARQSTAVCSRGHDLYAFGLIKDAAPKHRAARAACDNWTATLGSRYGGLSSPLGHSVKISAPSSVTPAVWLPGPDHGDIRDVLRRSASPERASYQLLLIDHVFRNLAGN